MHDLDVRMLSNSNVKKYSNLLYERRLGILFEHEHECQLEQSQSWHDGKQQTDTFLSLLFMKWFKSGPK